MSRVDDPSLAVAVADFDQERAAAVAGALGLLVGEMLAPDMDATGWPGVEGAPCVVLYQAPWEGCLALADLGDDSTDPGRTTHTDSWLDAWLAAYSRVALLQSQWPERIRLVNAGRENAAEVLCHLAGLPGDGQELAQLQAVLPKGANAWSRILGTWMAQTATELWRVYEILESCAQGDGRPAEFRIGLRCQDDGRHGACTRVLMDAMRASSQEQMARMGETLEDLHRENALLATELEHLHAELAQQARSEQALHALVLDAGRAAEQARHQIAGLHLHVRQPD